MRWLSTLAIILGCAACQPQPDGTQVSALPGQPQPPQGQAELACHDFTAPVTAAGNPEQASGQACGQPDGSWRVVQNTPGLPAQTYVLPSPGQPAPAAASPAAAKSVATRNAAAAVPKARDNKTNMRAFIIVDLLGFFERHLDRATSWHFLIDCTKVNAMRFCKAKRVRRTASNSLIRATC